jgi:glycosyltransferase involved in cell wall biosynthesis
MTITAILPVSRLQFLDRVLESLLAQTHKPNYLLVVFDGLESDLVEARNKIIGLDFESVRFVQSENLTPAFSIPDRRRHITNIHNQMSEMIGETDWVFSIEDDGILPPNALERLVKIAKEKDNLGMVTGVELGRWGVPYVGAWTVDNINDVHVVTSMENRAFLPNYGVEEIDACGLYCALIRGDLYREHNFFTDNGLGPDVNLGLYIRKLGYSNYIDWGIPVAHLTTVDGQEVVILPLELSKPITLRLLSYNTWQATR